MGIRLSQKDFIKVAIKTNGRCFYCNKLGEVVDYFVSKHQWEDWGLDFYIGSCDCLENLFLACAKCNGSKGKKSPDDFIGNSYTAWLRYEKANKRIGIIIPHLD